MSGKYTAFLKRHPMLLLLARWYDNELGTEGYELDQEKKVEWIRIAPFIFLHLGCLAVFWVGWSWIAVGVAFGMYCIRMFTITAFFHRYFSHRAFKTNRFFQMIFAVIGGTAVQRGALWWAGHHRHHHRFSDTEQDRHSPVQHGFLWSHMGWLTNRGNFPTPKKYVQDWMQYPELRWLNRHDILIPLALALVLFIFGEVLQAHRPHWGSDGWQMVVWGFFISSTALFHATVTINSLSHMWGSRRYETPDTSRNNALLAIITLGEGWHNNHHFYPVAARQGFFWWEIDITYYVLVVLSWLGIIWDLRPLPPKLRSEGGRSTGQPSVSAGG